MSQPRNKAVVAGLAVTIALGGVALPAIATTAPSSAAGAGADNASLPAPAAYDKADFYQGAAEEGTAPRMRAVSSLEPVTLSDEMKYFAKYESSCNYDQGLSYGDGYNAMGYYQFDRRYSLLPFIQQVRDYNPSKYAMFDAVLEQRGVLTNGAVSLYDSAAKKLTRAGQVLNNAWHAAYAADPVEFSALQDSYAYSSYYLPVEKMLRSSYGVEISNRADCVKGLVWGMCNLFGQGGVQNYFRDAHLSNSMTDRELVTALCDTVVERVSYYCSSQPRYWEGWQNRYRKEKAQCLKYLDEHEAEQNAKPGPQPEPQPQPDPQPEPEPKPDLGSRPEPEQQPQPQPEPEPQQQPQPQPEPEQQPQPQPEPKPDPNPQSQPDPQPQPNPQPAPETPNSSDPAPEGQQPEGDGGSANSPQAHDGAPDSQDGAPNNESDSAAPKDPVAGETADSAGQDKKPSDGMNASGTPSNNKEVEKEPQVVSQAPVKTAEAKAGLPGTGDITAMVLTGAAGLTAAGASFLSLGKKERAKDEGANGQGDE